MAEYTLYVLCLRFLGEQGGRASVGLLRGCVGGDEPDQARRSDGDSDDDVFHRSRRVDRSAAGSRDREKASRPLQAHGAQPQRSICEAIALGVSLEPVARADPRR